MTVAIIILLAVTVVFFAWASYSIRGGVYVRSFCRNAKAGRRVAITFDDGVDEERTPSLLDVLKKYDIHATFFVIGSRSEKYPEIVRRIVDQGHTIGNHSYAHESTFPMKSCRAMVEDLQRAEKAITEASGVKIKYFRPPYGVTNPMVACAVKRMGYRSIGWSIRSLDTMNRSREWVLNRIERQLGNGKVILLHDDRPMSALLAEKVIKTIIGKGYEIVPLEELMNKTKN